MDLSSFSVKSINKPQGTQPLANQLPHDLPSVSQSRSVACPNCYTRFMLKPEQLNAQQGLVRCGLCLHIFNALSIPGNAELSVNRALPFSKNIKSKKRIVHWFGYLLISGMALMAALTLFFRNTLTQYFPNSATIFQPICHLLSCSLLPVHDIDALEIIHSELLTGKDADTYVLRIILQNQVNFAVYLPALEISLINPQGKLIVRRVLNAQEYLPASNKMLVQQGLQGKTALPFEITLRTKETAASYQLFSFYPN